MNFWQKANQWWLWLTLFLIPFSIRKVINPVFYQGVFVDYASISLFLSDLLIIGLLLLWVVDFKRSGKLNWGPKLLTLPLLLLAGWMWVSLLWATPDIWISIQSAIRFSLYIGLYFYLINRVSNIKTLLYPLLAGAAVQGGLAIVQHSFNHSLGLKWLGESVLDPAKSGIPVVLVDGVRQLRAHGTLPHANVLGGYLAVVLALMWPLLFSQERRVGQWIWWVVAGLGFIGMTLSFSRSAWLIFIGGGVIVLIWLAWKHSVRLLQGLKIGWPIILVVIAFALSQWQAIMPRWSSDFNLVEQISVNSRIEQWQEFKGVYGRHVWSGVGIGQYFLNIWQPQKNTVAKSLNYYQPVHNIYLLALAELGPIGLGLLLWILGSVAYLSIRLCRQGVVWGVAVLWAVATVFGVGLVDHYWWILPIGRLTFMLVLGSVAVLWAKSGYNGNYGRAKSTSIS